MRLVDIALLLFGISPAFAVTDAAKTRELQDVQSKIQKVGGDVRVLNAEKVEQLDQLKKLEKHYGELINAVNTLKAQIVQYEHSLQDIRNKITATQRDLRSQQQGLEGLIKAVAAMGSKDNLTVFLTPDDPTLSSRMRVYYDYVSKARLQKLQLIEQDFQTLRQLEAQKDSETQLIQQALAEKQQETDHLQQIKLQREKVLAEIKTQFVDKQEQLQRLEHDARKLEALLASLPKSDDNGGRSVTVVREALTPRPPTPAPVSDTHEPQKHVDVSLSTQVGDQSFEAFKGKLPWPVQGAITEHFGSKRYEMNWDGVVINAHEGAEVRAVAAGRVVYADWLRGYGLMVIIDHGKGYISLYAFNQSINKSAGAHVRAGEMLATVGRSGGRSGPALYFGIRNRGVPLNPEHWCRSH